MKTILGIIVVIVIALGGWYWWSQSSQAPAVASPSTAMGTNGSPNQGNLGQPDNGTPQQPAGTGMPTLGLGMATSTKLGTHLIGTGSMTLYTFKKDSTGTTTCYGQCATNWPPYAVAPGIQIVLQDGITGKFATVMRADGMMQLTYKGMPLYFYIKDVSPGDTTGQAVNNVWFVAKP